MTFPLLPRSQWMRALAAADEARIVALAARLASDLQATPSAPPRAGLALLRLRESVMLDTFYLGEIPVASARVLLRAPDGRRVEGGAIVMDDSGDLAAALAVLDGVLAHDLPGAHDVEGLLREGQAEIDGVARVRGAMLARTRVDFSLMAEVGNGDDA